MMAQRNGQDAPGQAQPRGKVRVLQQDGGKTIVSMIGDFCIASEDELKDSLDKVILGDSTPKIIIFNCHPTTYMNARNFMILLRAFHNAKSRGTECWLCSSGPINSILRIFPIDETLFKLVDDPRELIAL